MSKFTLTGTALALSMLAAPAFASNGGDRTAAGGAFMSSYSTSPYATRSQQPASSFDGTSLSGGRDVGATGSVKQRRPDGRR